MKREPYSFRELNVRTLPDFETLAVKQGGCWCIFYQRANPLRTGTTSEEWKRRNRVDKRALVRAGRSHAILVYDGTRPVGWCQYGPQEELPRIDARRTYREVAPPVSTAKLWRITCFFVDPKYRKRGIAKLALGAALESIRKKGGGVVEAYPVVAKMAAVPEWRWFGTPSMFRKQGFAMVAKLGTSGVLMRKRVRRRSQRNLNRGPRIQRVAGR